MTENAKAGLAEETAKVEATAQESDKEFDAGFDEAMESQTEPKKKAAKKEDPKEEEKQEDDSDKKVDSKSDEKKEEQSDAKADDKKDGEDKKDDADRTALQKAEEAAAKLKDGQKPDSKEDGNTENGDGEPQSVLELLPEKYGWAKDVVGTSGFKDWLAKQSGIVQRLARSGNPDDAIAVLDAYKEKAPAKEEQAGGKTASKIDAALKKIAELDEGVAEAVKTLVDDLREELTGKIPQQVKQDEETPKTVKELKAEMESMKAQRIFMEEVADAHPDAGRISRSKVFNEWAEKQSDQMKRLWRSPVAEHAILFLDAYKEAKAAEEKAKNDAEGGAKKKQLDDVHGSTLKGGKSAAKKGADKEDSESDFDEGFEQGAKK